MAWVKQEGKKAGGGEERRAYGRERAQHLSVRYIGCVTQQSAEKIF